MPRISDQFQDCSIYLYASHDDAVRGERTGGSGFIVGVPGLVIPNGNFFYAVTNAHVIESGATTIRLNKRDGTFDVIDTTELSWICHPKKDDVAIFGFNFLDEKLYKYRSLDPQFFLTKDDVLKYNIGPGDDTFVVGRFINAEGRQRNAPTVRSGTIAQMPDEKIIQKRDFGLFAQESFLVEARTISGYSGSPVFVMVFTDRSRQGGQMPPRQIYLLGISWGYIKDNPKVIGPNGRPVDTGLYVETNTGLMGVVPVWKLADILFGENLVDYRMRMETKFIAKHGPIAAELTSTSGASLPTTDESPTHREDFTSLLGVAAKTKPQDD